MHGVAGGGWPGTMKEHPTQNTNSAPAEKTCPSPVGLRPHQSLNKWFKKCHISCLVCLVFSPSDVQSNAISLKDILKGT